MIRFLENRNNLEAFFLLAACRRGIERASFVFVLCVWPSRNNTYYSGKIVRLTLC